MSIFQLHSASLLIAGMNAASGGLRKTARFLAQSQTLRRFLRILPASTFDGLPAPPPPGLCSALLLNCPLGILSLDAQERITFANPKAENLLGYPAASLLGKRLSAFAPSMQSELQRILNSAQQGGAESAFIPVLRRDGRQVELSLSLSPFDLPEQPFQGLIAVLQEVGAAPNLEAGYLQAVARLERTQAFAHLGNWEVEFVREPGRPIRAIYSWSDEVYRIFGLHDSRPTPSEELFLSRVHPEDRDRVRAASALALATGQEYRCDHRLLLPDGSTRHVREHASLEFDSAGNPVRMLGTVQDMNQIRELEARHFDSQKLESVARLAGGVAHEFNNLLTIVNGYAELALAGMSQTDSLFRPLSEIRIAGKRAAKLTDQLLSFSGKQVIAPKTIHLANALAGRQALFAKILGEGISLRLELPENLRTVWFDQGQFDQILMNLIVNARDAMPSGGSVTIGAVNVDLAEDDLARLPGLRPGPHVLLWISDSGVGMTDHVMRNLFQPFFTTKGQGSGTGLGLSCVHGIVRQSGGAIDVSSELGSGSRFSLYLPEAPTPLSTDATLLGEHELFTATSPLPGGQEVILLVEDQPDLLLIESIVLTRLGYRVIEAASGEEALACCTRAGGLVDLLITDVVMPGMSGPQLARRVAKIVPAVRVLYCSGYSRDLVTTRGVLQEGTNYLAKPFSPDVLATKVREVLDRPAHALS